MSGKYYLKYVNKKHTEKAHFKKRFKERIGVECSRKCYNNIIYDIKNKNSILLYKLSTRVFCFLQILFNKKFIIVYDKFRDSLVTLIPEENFTIYQLEYIDNLSKTQYKKLYNKEKNDV